MEMFLTIKPYLHVNCALMLNWIISNGNVFDIETVFTLNWFVQYRNRYLYYTDLDELELFD